jgi:hypothetical protein
LFPSHDRVVDAEFQKLVKDKLKEKLKAAQE